MILLRVQLKGKAQHQSVIQDTIGIDAKSQTVERLLIRPR
jgi:hypothetical protein